MAASSKSSKANEPTYVKVPQIVIRRLRPDKRIYWGNVDELELGIRNGSGAAWFRDQKLKALMRHLETGRNEADSSYRMTAKDRAALFGWLARYVADLLMPEFDADEFHLIFTKVLRKIFGRTIRRRDADQMLAHLCENQVIGLRRAATTKNAAVYGFWRRPRKARS